ncbi:DUF4267 domain-containing protein [Labedaea rhizosphaerae]|uniref:Uncharacterized protein DUF4267 n=1 Tax=Labedaea rhizosphaerae TaxID=598644 RepID=A0A4R6SCF6_LABRH|nr:DUF4267 domain-containing protein [Labedaea rhizosphaerae]TDP96635.1 uncharacterized protein DUF4267 [Labedaea rhizosphaerae]
MTWEKRTGLVLAVLGSLFIGYIGVRYLAGPAAMAPSFVGADQPRPDAAAYLGNAKGVRDLFSGVVLLVLLATGQFRALGWVLLTVAIVPIGDMIIVLAHHGAPATAFGVHGVTAALVLIGAALILRGTRER